MEVTKSKMNAVECAIELIKDAAFSAVSKSDEYMVMVKESKEHVIELSEEAEIFLGEVLNAIHDIEYQFANCDIYND